MFPCAMSAGIVSAEARIVRLHLSEAYHGAPERLLFLSLIFVIFAYLSFSSFFFFLHLFNSFLFLLLYSLSILNTISFLFLVISIVRPQSCFYRFFCNFCQTPPARPATGSQAITSFAYEKLSSKCIHLTVCSSLRHFEKNIQRTQCCQLCYSAVFRRLFGKENREKM